MNLLANAIDPINSTIYWNSVKTVAWNDSDQHPFWEIFEFTADALLGTANQKWNLQETEFIIGRYYQGSGLRDTMSDLIVDSIGACITSIITYYMYKNKKESVLESMKKMRKDSE